jgi:ubiquitin fusion degradation protein 1
MHYTLCTHTLTLPSPFINPQGTAYIPFWMMQNLMLGEGALLTVTNVSLPKATHLRLQAQSVDFLDITNHRAVLEHALRKFSCMTKGDMICFPYMDKKYHLEVKDIKPNDACCIIEADVNLDFDQPVGYVERDYKKEAEEAKRKKFENMPKQSRFGGDVPSPAVSARSSPTGSAAGSTAGSASGSVPPMALGAASEQPTGPRIVNGRIIGAKDSKDTGPETSFLADKIGSTGVQRNAAIPEKAPETTYWAIAGGGSRLDGKKPSPLKDNDGKELDVREVRAAAAAARLAAQNSNANNNNEAPSPARKSIIGNKFSKRKVGGATAFGGSGNKM